MSLNGSAFLALWNDVDSMRDAEYNCWHTFEHVPERVGIAGILSGRRYMARERNQDRYFTLYELDQLGALVGPEYADVVQHPTQWTLSMRPSLRNFQRHPCTTLFSMGEGIAGSIATLRFDANSAMSDAWVDVVRSSMKPFLRATAVTSIHLGLKNDDTRFPLKNVQKPHASEPGTGFVLMVEGIERSDLDVVVPRIVETIEGCHDSIEAVVWKTFELAFAIDRSGLRYPAANRQPERPDLRRRWNQQQ